MIGLKKGGLLCNVRSPVLRQGPSGVLPSQGGCSPIASPLAVIDSINLHPHNLWEMLSHCPFSLNPT